MKRSVLAVFVLLAAMAIGCGTAERLANRAVDVSFNDAMAKGDLPGAQSFLDQGADINARFDLTGGHTTLTMLAGRGYMEGMEFLLEHGADPNLGSDKGRTALMQAASGGRIDEVELLLEHGADPEVRDSEGKTAADYAAEAGHAELLPALNPVT